VGETRGERRCPHCGEDRLIDWCEVLMRWECAVCAKSWRTAARLPHEAEDRNLTPEAASLLRGRLYNRAKKAQNDGGKGTPKGTVPQTEERFLITEVEVPGRMTTAERLAQQHGVGRATIERDGQFAEAVEEPGLTHKTSYR
jgi:hypothetical protein